jgi:hypothetical protein
MNSINITNTFKDLINISHNERHTSITLVLPEVKLNRHEKEKINIIKSADYA